jgi:hypothetical protein
MTVEVPGTYYESLGERLALIMGRLSRVQDDPGDGGSAWHLL